MDKVELFELEIRRSPSGANIHAEIILPATTYELADALAQARITDEHKYLLDILSCELEYLPQFISGKLNLYELNHLASHLSELSEWELDCFEGMVIVESIILMTNSGMKGK